MHDVLVHYLEVNFPEIAEQLAHARTREPGNEERAAAAERLRELTGCNLDPGHVAAKISWLRQHRACRWRYGPSDVHP